MFMCSCCWSNMVRFCSCGEDERPLNELLLLQLGEENTMDHRNISGFKIFGKHWNQVTAVEQKLTNEARRNGVIPSHHVCSGLLRRFETLKFSIRSLLAHQVIHTPNKHELFLLWTCFRFLALEAKENSKFEYMGGRIGARRALSFVISELITFPIRSRPTESRRFCVSRT